jgi:anti-sigma factor RsiW
MQCSDLERYLEAYLDLRLGRSRGAILRRHLSACASCRARVNHLRQFERDLQRQFRAMERAQSVWNGLEPDLVRSGGGLGEPPALTFLPPEPLPPIAAPAGASAARVMASASPEPPAAGETGRRQALRLWARRIVGAMLVLAAVGAVGTSVTDVLRPGVSSAPLRAYFAYRDGTGRLGLTTGDSERLRDWFAARLGSGFPEPPQPAGFALAGGWVDETASPPAAAIVYDRDGLTTLLYVESRPSAASTVAGSAAAEPAEGLSQASWTRDGYAWSLVSPLPGPELGAFQPATAGAL